MRGKLLVGVVVLWAVAVVGGMAMLADYKYRPGARADEQPLWPADSKLARGRAVPTLVMFAHPKCTCTRASLTELAELMAEARGNVRAHVVFMKPSEQDGDWAHSDTWDQAREIRGVEVSIDVDAAEAHRFGAQTSGQVVLYGVDGRLLYAGGITSARGHVGTSIGHRRLLALLTHRATDAHTGNVYGCALAEREKDAPR